jgi:photosystem II stability/assembly factor-like uncharacterized protein
MKSRAIFAPCLQCCLLAVALQVAGCTGREAARLSGSGAVDHQGDIEKRSSATDSSLTTDWRAFAVSLSGDIVVSLNGNTGWSYLASTPHRGAVRALAVTREGVFVAVGLRGGIWRSKDRGKTWSAVAHGLTQEHLTQITGLKDDALVAVGQGGTALRSEDDGFNWVPYSLVKSAQLPLGDTNPSSHYVPPPMLAQALQSSEVWSVGTGPGGNLLVVAVSGSAATSSDDGRTWHRVSANETLEGEMTAYWSQPKGGIIFVKARDQLRDPY